MSHSQGNDNIYEELRGYFPPEYDLTPEELEEQAALRREYIDDFKSNLRAQLDLIEIEEEEE